MLNTVLKGRERMILFNDTLGAYGGSHTLMVRMCKWLTQNGIRCGIICDNRNNEEIATELESFGTEIYVVDIQKPKVVRDLVLEIGDQIKVISFVWNFYLDIERAKKVYDMKFDNLIYCIHPATFEKGTGLGSNYLRKLILKKYRGILNRMNENNAIIMMDEINTIASENFFNMKFSSNPVILRLPMNCRKIDEHSRIIDDGYKNRLIMTASRAEIPYKGYLLGLIDDFKELKTKYPDIKLLIVSAGADLGLIKEKIKGLSLDVQGDITLQGWMKYDELSTLMETCTVFIGMGTSVLDASLKYKPSIPVRFYTKENLAESLFTDNPYCIAANTLCTSKAISLLDDVLRLPKEEYSKLAEKSFDMVNKHYNIDETLDKMCNVKTMNSKSILTQSEAILHWANNRLNAARHKKEDQFDVRMIEK